ncbi:hypothetical protein [Halomonas sp. KM-1]|uniref:hypothetical protein n=1 Tax=Halomonas sp. KM-1 TaxID=590061 RepID=UPI00028803EB|nr:hypothetical protein [Halomonas sp. KM-1]
MIIVLALATALALIRLGGGAYEYSVIDPAWPKRPELIQPDRGGVSRKRFWIPAHLSFELLLLASLVLAWAHPSVRLLLLIALLSHVAMRAWSALDFIPRALAFERADPATVEQHEAQRWVQRSLLRLPFDLATCAALLGALIVAARLGG